MTYAPATHETPSALDEAMRRRARTSCWVALVLALPSFGLLAPILAVGLRDSGAALLSPLAIPFLGPLFGLIGLAPALAWAAGMLAAVCTGQAWSMASLSGSPLPRPWKAILLILCTPSVLVTISAGAMLVDFLV